MSRLSRTLVFSLAFFAQSMPGQAPRTADDWKAWIGRGVESFKLGHYRDSVTAFQHAVDLNPGDPIPHVYLGIAWEAQFVPGAQDASSGDQAMSQYRRGIELDADNWPALVLMAKLARDRGDFDGARSWYEKALRLDPANADTWVALGALGRRSQVTDQGAPDLQRALLLDHTTCPQ